MIVGNIINLHSRYGDKNYLIPFEFTIPNFSNTYKLKLENPEFGVGITYNEDNSIMAIDPPGGPYMAIDTFYILSPIESKRFFLKKITFEKNIGFLLTFIDNG